MSNTITDKAGRVWPIEINVRSLSRVRRLLDLNLLELVFCDNQVLEKLAEFETLANVLYVLCQPQCHDRGVNDEQFGESLTRDNLDEGFLAILEGVITFSPRALRPACRKALRMAREATATEEAAGERVAETPEFLTALAEAILPPSALRPPPSETTPERSPTESSTAATSSEEWPEWTPGRTPWPD